jgi:hypothetical protein
LPREAPRAAAVVLRLYRTLSYFMDSEDARELPELAGAGEDFRGLLP